MPREQPTPAQQSRKPREAIGVAMLMNGGPATIYGPRAYSAFCEFVPSLAAVLAN